MNGFTSLIKTFLKEKGKEVPKSQTVSQSVWFPPSWQQREWRPQETLLLIWYSLNSQRNPCAH